MVLPYSRFSRKDEVLTHGVFYLPPACEYPGWLLMDECYSVPIHK
jgi:hypothetical protein